MAEALSGGIGQRNHTLERGAPGARNLAAGPVGVKQGDGKERAAGTAVRREKSARNAGPLQRSRRAWAGT